MAKGKKTKAVPQSAYEKRSKIPHPMSGVDNLLLKKWVRLTFLAALFLIALLVRLYFSRYFKTPLVGDSVIYAKIAWGIKNGYGLHWWSVVWSPFYPFMIVLFSIFTGGLETAATFVSLVLGSLLVIPFFFLAKSMFSHQVAYLASILVVFFPALVVNSEVPMSEATYTFFLMITLLCGWLFIRIRSYLLALLFGIFSGISYLTRPEFLVAFACLLLVFLIIQLRTKITAGPNFFVLLAIILAAFLILALPYINFMHSQTGNWMLSGKMAHNILKENVYAAAKETDYRVKRESLSQALDGLTPQGELKGRVLLGQWSMLNLLKAPHFWSKYFQRLWQGLKDINFFMATFLLFSLFYLFSWKTEKGGLAPRLFLLSSFAPLVAIPVLFVLFVVAGRLIEPYMPVIILMAVAGMFNLVNAIMRTGKYKSSAAAIRLGFGAWLAVVALLSIFSLAQANHRITENHEMVLKTTKWLNEYKKLGQWMDGRLPQNASVMCFTTWDSLIFYCNRRVYPLPFATWPEIIRFAKVNQIGYLLVSWEMTNSERKDLTFLWEPLKNQFKTLQDSSITFMGIYQAPSGIKAALYNFEF